MITEHDDDQIDRYLNRQLDAAAADAFEIRMMEEPDLLERVQLVEAMKQGLQKSQSTLLTPAPVTAKVMRFPQWIRQPLSMAASVLLATLLMRNILVPTPATVESTGINTVLLLENSRGTATAEFSGAPPYLLQLDAGLGNTANSFAVTLRDTTNNAVVTQLGDLQADADGWVRLIVSEALTGDYVAELSWADAEGAAQTRSFTLNVSP
ncbi:MAG: hypothetical protein V4603_13780 [Pseudomonadota bacterium]